jgi:hypothetical protein
MNPFDAVGTARVSQAIADRMCRILLSYQQEEAERRIVEQQVGWAGPLPNLCVSLTRATRTHPEVRMGASVRGAIDLALLAEGLRKLRAQREFDRDTVLDAALTALSGRIRVEDGVARTAEDIITELVDRLWSAETGGSGKAGRPGRDPFGGPAPSPGHGSDAFDRASRRTLSRRELERAHPRLSPVSPQVGQFDEAAFEKLLADDPDEATALLSADRRSPGPSSAPPARPGGRRSGPPGGRPAAPGGAQLLPPSAPGPPPPPTSRPGGPACDARGWRPPPGWSGSAPTAPPGRRRPAGGCGGCGSEPHRSPPCAAADATGRPRRRSPC